MPIDAYSPERLADRAQIQDVMYRYCRAIDRQQLHELETVFHADATTDNGHFVGTIPDFVEAVRNRHALIPQAFHMVANILIDFLAADRAFVESYCLAFEHHLTGGSEQIPDAPVDRIVRVRYCDIFERREGQWKVAERIVVLDHEMGVPVEMTPLLFAGGRNARGVRNASDPIVQKRKSLGLIG